MALKLKFRTQFPASVLVQSPMVLEKEGSTYTFSLDADEIQSQFNTLFQVADQALTSLSGLDASAGIVAQTAADTFTKRTLTGTANQITVTNGDGGSGNPTLSLPSALTFTGKTITGGAYTGATYEGNTLTAGTWTLAGGSGRTLTFNNTLTLAGTNGTTITFQGTDTYVGRATTDTLTNKTFDTAGTGNSLLINGTQVNAKTGTGSTVVLSNSPTLTTPDIGAATGLSLRLSNPSIGLGYSTGAGGTVTQATAKTTGVTLNTVTGQITMNAASLAAGSVVSFTLTNSNIVATDVIIINHTSGGTFGGYIIQAQAAAGSAIISVRNPTGGALAEAIVLAYAVIRSATS